MKPTPCLFLGLQEPTMELYACFPQNVPSIVPKALWGESARPFKIDALRAESMVASNLELQGMTAFKSWR